MYITAFRLGSRSFSAFKAHGSFQASCGPKGEWMGVSSIASSRVGRYEQGRFQPQVSCLDWL